MSTWIQRTRQKQSYQTWTEDIYQAVKAIELAEESLAEEVNPREMVEGLDKWKGHSWSKIEQEM